MITAFFITIILVYTTHAINADHWISPNVSHNNNKCDFHIIQLNSTLTARQFHERYINLNIPVLLKGAALHWTAIQKWHNKTYVLNQLENVTIPGHSNGVIDILKDKRWSKEVYHSYKDAILTLAAQPYLFSKLNINGTVSNTSFNVLQDIGTIRLFNEWNGALTYYLILGGQDSGLGFHNHRQAYCALVKGTKRWFIIPHKGINRIESTPTWNDDTPNERNLFLHNLKKLDPKPLECYQEEGDVVFVPNFFRHSVFNIGEVVAISAVHYENDDGDDGGGTRGYRSVENRGDKDEEDDEDGEDDDGDDDGDDGDDGDAMDTKDEGWQEDELLSEYSERMYNNNES